MNSSYKNSGKPAIWPILEKYAEDGWNAREPFPGRWVNITCPFHTDKHASAAVNTDPEVQQFYCHAAHCGVAGDAYKIVMEREGCDFAQAVAVVSGLTGQAGSRVPGRTLVRSSLLPAWTRNRRRRDRAVPHRGSYG